MSFKSALRSRRRLLRLENLEDRRMLAYSGQFLNSVLTITSDGGHNTAMTMSIDGSGSFIVNGEYMVNEADGYASNDTCSQINILGGAGQDGWSPPGGVDVPMHFSGGGGHDRLYVGGSGNWTVTASKVRQFSFDGIEHVSVAGDDGPNKIFNYGFPGSVAFLGYGGNDELAGGPGEDSLYGGDGNDTLQGWANNDSLYGGSGGDTIRGGDGDDTIFGDGGGDTIEGGKGRDLLYGNADADRITDLEGENNFFYGGTGDDVMKGGAGRDTMYGEAGADTMEGGNNNDSLHGGDGNDTLRGQAGGDYLYPGLGVDQVFGGEGYDSLFETRNNHFTLTATSLKIADQTDTLTALENVSLTGGESGNQFTITDGISSVNIAGKGGTDRIVYNTRNTEVSITGGVRVADLMLISFNPSISSVSTYQDPIEELYVNLTPGDDHVDIRDFRGKIGRINGGEGTNEISYTKDADITLTDTVVKDSLGNVINFSNFKEANISAVEESAPIAATGSSSSEATRKLDARDYTAWVRVKSGISTLELRSSASWETVELQPGGAGEVGLIRRSSGGKVDFDLKDGKVLKMISKASTADIRFIGDPVKIAALNPDFRINVVGTGGTDKLSWSLTGSAHVRFDFDVRAGNNGYLSGATYGAINVPQPMLEFSSFERFAFTGNDGAGEVRFNSVGDNPVPIKATVNGSGGTDRVVFKGVMPANVTLTDDSITGSNGTAIALSSVEEAALSIDPRFSTTLNVSGWHKRGFIYSETFSGSIKVLISGDANYTLRNDRLTRSTGGDFTLTKISNFEIIGGSSANTIDASQFTLGDVVLRGGKGSDTLRGGSRGDDLYGEDGNDFLYGNAGDDTLYGGNDNDTGDGGDNFDVGHSLETKISIEESHAALSAIAAAEEENSLRKRRR